MIIKIPRSLYDEIYKIKKDSNLLSTFVTSSENIVLTVLGPFGNYIVEPLDDVHFTEEVIEKVRRYRDDSSL